MSAARTIVIGSGGHARVLLEALSRLAIPVHGLTDHDAAKRGKRVGGVEVLGDDSILERFPPESTVLVNGVGSIDSMQKRKEVFERLKRHGYRFLTIVHPSAVVAADAVLEEGAQVMAGAIVQAAARIGRNTIVNTGAQVDHVCTIGDHVHLAPGALLSGEVRIADEVHVGAGAVIIQGLEIGSGALVAAGAVVVRNVAAGGRVAGTPARDLQA